MTWTNNDGLQILFGNEKGKRSVVGTPSTMGEVKTINVELDHSRFAAAGTATEIDVNKEGKIPSGAIIVGATLDVTEAFTSGGAATLTIGTREADGTVIDADGIDATIALAALNAVGKHVACDGAQVNGAALAANAHLQVTVGTAAYTAGRAKLQVNYILPAAF
jgi:hypothetical protein